MSERMTELNQLWEKNFGEGLSPAEESRLAELMSDDTLMEAFSQEQAAAAAAEPEASLSVPQWAALDGRVLRRFSASRYSRLLKPLALACGVALVSAAGWGFFKSDAAKRPDLGLAGEKFSEKEKQPVAKAEKSRPALEKEKYGSREIRASKISVVLEQPSKGEAFVRVLDSKGSLVQTLHSGELAAGKFRFVWNGLDAQGRKASPGVYSIELKNSKGVETRRLEIREKK
jgi:hypothetical protein